MSRSIAERYATATEATDLTLRNERSTAVDVLTAAGMVGAKHALALSLWRWAHGGDNNARHDVLSGLLVWMRRQATKRNWQRVRAGTMARVVLVVAEHYHSPACTVCSGHGYEPINGTPHLSDTPCPVCHGTGECSLDKMLMQHGPDWISRGKQLRAYMDDLMHVAGKEMMRKLARDMQDGGL